MKRHKSILGAATAFLCAILIALLLPLGPISTLAVAEDGSGGNPPPPPLPIDTTIGGGGQGYVEPAGGDLISFALTMVEVLF